jgi:hypothetical protein
MAVFVILRSENDFIVYGMKEQRIRQWVVDPAVGPYGGIIMTHIKCKTPVYKDGEAIKKRKVEQEVSEWLPVECPTPGCVEPLIHKEGEALASCPRCHVTIPWREQKWYICEATEWDAQRLANIKTDWQCISVRTLAEAQAYKQAPEESPAEYRENMAAVRAEPGRVQQARAQVGVNAWHELRRKAKAIMEAGGPDFNLRAKRTEVENYVREHEGVLENRSAEPAHAQGVG